MYSPKYSSTMRLKNTSTKTFFIDGVCCSPHSEISIFSLKSDFGLDDSRGDLHTGVALFVISFIVVVGIVVLNVVVAILLEGIVNAMQQV